MYTSAKNSSGIDELFKKIGNQYFDPNNNINVNSNSNTNNNSVKLDNRVDNKKKKDENSGCCK